MSTSLHPLVAAFSEARKAQGLTQAQLAERLGVDRTVIAHFEAQRTRSALAKWDGWFGALGLELVPIPRDLSRLSNMTARDMAEILREAGWTVEPPSARGDFW